MFAVLVVFCRIPKTLLESSTPTKSMLSSLELNFKCGDLGKLSKNQDVKKR